MKHLVLLACAMIVAAPQVFAKDAQDWIPLQDGKTLSDADPTTFSPYQSKFLLIR